mmetsp:Transcript_29752/g.70757  ORF Transcript_29752/g.70757 Transcript_29752/m.70757 type:complete len:242 (-) Transcript_29752:530-1255(-)
MDDAHSAHCMDVGQSRQRVLDDKAGVLFCQRASVAAAEVLEQVWAFQELHHHEEMLIAHQGVEELHHVGVRCFLRHAKQQRHHVALHKVLVVVLPHVLSVQQLYSALHARGPEMAHVGGAKSAGAQLLRDLVVVDQLRSGIVLVLLPRTFFQTELLANQALRPQAANLLVLKGDVLEPHRPEPLPALGLRQRCGGVHGATFRPVALQPQAPEELVEVLLLEPALCRCGEGLHADVASPNKL